MNLLDTNAPILLICFSYIHTIDFFGGVWDVQELCHEYKNMLSVSTDI